MSQRRDIPRQGPRRPAPRTGFLQWIFQKLVVCQNPVAVVGLRAAHTDQFDFAQAPVDELRMLQQ
ncbi:hypothetical protein ACC679_38395, partial [Rhizobium ruizarguesonis]